tara:strand:- start:86 stop:400 length:315 start_codon:yes stop_codon:yes gene_type:complete
MRKHYGSFTELDAQIVAVSTDKTIDARKMSSKINGQFPILSDENGEVARLYQTFNLLKDNLSTPSVFILRPDLSIQWEHIAKATHDRPSTDDILNQIRKFSDIH